MTRFILICNYVTRIIQPLASRCAKFRFQSLPPLSMRHRLEQIADEEGCSESTKSLLDDILQHAGGDMRRAVTTLQSVHSLSSTMTKDDIAEIAGLPPPSVVDDLWTVLGSAKSFDGMQKAVEDVTAGGYSAQVLLSGMLPKIIKDDVLNEKSKALIAIRLAEAEKNMIDGADEYLQLMTVCSLALQCFQASQQATN